MSVDGLSFSESSDGVSGSEVSQEALEQFQENARRAAAQAKKDQKTEGKQKKQEDVLSHIIVQFLQTPKYSGFFLLISRALQKNIPSYFLLSIISLIHKGSLDALQAQDIPKKNLRLNAGNLPEKQSSLFPKNISTPLSHWTTLMENVSAQSPDKVLETVLDENWKLDENIAQLMSLVMREFFQFKKYKTPFENITIFSNTFLTNLTSSLEANLQTSVQN